MKLNLKLGLVFGFWISSIFSKQVKFCVVNSITSRSIVNEICPRYEDSSFDVKCVIANDRLTCMRFVVDGIADFLVSQPEDLAIVIENHEQHFMITHELRLWKNDTFRSQVVAIMHKDMDDFSDVRKSKLCYPGLLTRNFADRDYTSYFEKKLVPRECDPTKTFLENRISSLSDYFEAACIAGTWSLDSAYDSYLKNKYKNLCALCQNPVGCYSDDKYSGKEGALLCLTEGAGDITWTKWSSANKHFMVQKIRLEDFNYLCQDGSVRSFASEKCAWIGEPWPVVMARADIAKEVTQLILIMVAKNDRFLRLLGSVNINRSINQLDPMTSPDTYLQRYSAYADASSISTCYPPREIRWCVTSIIEYRKCDSMRSAAFAYNIYPQIFCVQEASRDLCMQAVRDRYADVFAITTNEELVARKYELKPILHMLSNSREDLNTVGILVKKTSTFKSFEDLKNAKACFTGYQSVGWNAAVAKIINTNKEEKHCSDIDIIAEYFGPSCVYGLSSANKTVPDKLYKLCNEFKENRSFNNYADDPDVMAFKCLSNAGDVAFVNISRAKEVFRQHGSNFANTYEIFCADEDKSGNDCFLTWTTLGSIMVNRNITSALEDEIREMILSFDIYFGDFHYGPSPLFSMYGKYDNVSNVIFSEKTKHIHREISNVKNGKSYSDILDDLIKHQLSCNAACTNNIQLFIYMIFILNFSFIQFY